MNDFKFSNQLIEIFLLNLLQFLVIVTIKLISWMFISSKNDFYKENSILTMVSGILF